MQFENSKLSGAVLITTEPHKDDRGFFVRFLDEEMFSQHGISVKCTQSSISHNYRMGSLRGMHFQSPPFEEDKLIMCVSGIVYDVIVDIRSDSPTYLLWQSFILDSENPQVLYVPKGFAHGFLSICDNARLLYHISAPYRPESASGYRWDDPSINIKWPLPAPYIMSSKDRSWAYI